MAEDPSDRSPDEVRRRLLRIAIYLPPTILGTIALSEGGCQPGSCNPASCNPNGGPCGPVGCNPNTGCNPH